MKTIELISRAIISHDNKILLVKHDKANYYFLPGGHIEFGETAEKALKRELKEELGATIDKLAFLQPVENIFKQDGKERHEINFLFLATLKSPKSQSLEKHLEFRFVTLKELTGIELKPKLMKDLILNK